MDDVFITLEIDDDRCGLLQFELPLDVTDDEIAYIIELVDPGSGEVVFNCIPILVH